MSYSQLTYEQRYLIYHLLKTGFTQAKIARFTGVHRSTISRELRRNTGKRGYRFKQAHRMAKFCEILTPCRQGMQYLQAVHGTNNFRW